MYLRASVGFSAVLLSSSIAFASGIITDGNASWSYDTASPVPGSVDFRPDGGGPGDDIMFQNWWWYRVEGDLTQTRLSWPPATESYIGDTAVLTGSEADFDWVLTVILNDDAVPCQAQVSEGLEITNTTASDMVVTTFNYANFDIGSDPNDDLATLPDPNVFNIFDEGVCGGEFEGVDAIAYQAGEPADMLDLLDNSTLLGLNDGGIPFGPGDFAGIFEFEASLTGGGKVTINENLKAIPEPSTLLLVGLGIGFASRRRRTLS